MLHGSWLRLNAQRSSSWSNAKFSFDPHNTQGAGSAQSFKNPQIRPAPTTVNEVYDIRHDYVKSPMFLSVFQEDHRPPGKRDGGPLSRA